MVNPERQHNALSALEVLFMAARAGIGFYARGDAEKATMFRVTVERRDNGTQETRTFMAMTADKAKALAAAASNVAKVLSVSVA